MGYSIAQNRRKLLQETAVPHHRVPLRTCVRVLEARGEGQGDSLKFWNFGSLPRVRDPRILLLVAFAEFEI